MRRDAWEVYSKTLGVSVALSAAVVALERWLSLIIHEPVLRWATASAAIEVGVIVSLSLSLLGLRSYMRLREGLFEQMRPAIRDRVLALAFEGESWSTAVPESGPGRQVLEENLTQALATVKSAGRERLARFAVEQGFATEWRKASMAGAKGSRKRAIFLLGLIAPVADGQELLLTALDDRQPGVRAEACRALLAAGGPPSADRVFRTTLREPLVVRALLADDLKRYAGYLFSHTIPSVLESASREEAACCFEMLIAWRRAMPGFDIGRWLWTEQDALLTPLILALLPYVWTEESVEDYVSAALRSQHLEVQCAAALVAGRLQLQNLLPVLEIALSGDKALALAAGAALAEMGEAGERSLERMVAGADRRAAAVALEALEHRTVRAR